MAQLKGLDEDTKRVIQFAEENGWIADKTNNGHLRFRKEGRQTTFHSSTPGDRRSGKNVISKLRRRDRAAQENPQ